MSETKTDVVIIGGGPAGMVAGLLLARAGVKTTVLEKHGDFLRDFRGDTVHPSTLRIFSELGLLDALLARPHQKLREIGGRIAGREMKLVDFSHLAVPAPFTALMPQWDFLDFVAGEARHYPDFTLRQQCEGAALIEEQGRVVGVRTGDGEEIRAQLTIAADGRDSRFRGSLPMTVIGAPMDVFWFRLPKIAQPTNDSMGVFDTGRLFVLIDRGDYWQCAFVFPKGAAEKIRGEGLAAFCDRVRAVGPETAGVDEAITDWEQVKLLTVTVDRLDRWHRPGLLLIGDAAHAMSPIGGVGINLAIQDAVAAANILAAPLARGEDVEALLPRIAARRLFPVKMTQGMQRAIQDRVIAPLLQGGRPLTKPPLVARAFDRFALLRRIPARLMGLGVRSEHVCSPDAGRRN
ncbi:MAG TPA: FAD-dependent oxidoreductase [Sphingomonas sp.]|nr:FAD-dependent oxidoreductase [Sphingomonas sp.]